nr:hypothetical protein [uncultured Carboxylicivirga sp.]
MKNIYVFTLLALLIIMPSCNSRNYLPPVDPEIPVLFKQDSLSDALIHNKLEQINELSRKAEDIAHLMEGTGTLDMDEMKGLDKIRFMKNFAQVMFIMKDFGEGMEEYQDSPSVELAVGDTLNAVDFLMKVMALRMIEIQQKYPHLKGVLAKASDVESDSTHTVMDFGF